MVGSLHFAGLFASNQPLGKCVSLAYILKDKTVVHILFVCSRNKWRSRTAETIFKDSQDFDVKSAGTEPSARIKESSKLIEWADLIFAMEKKHKQRLIENFPLLTADKQIILLDIPDEYQYMDNELIDIIKTSVSSYLDNVIKK